MDKSVSETIVQKEAGEPSVATQWQVMTSNAARSGDVLFIKGAFGEALDVSVGAAYAARHPQGPALSDKDPRGQKRQQVSAGGATQPASKEQRKTSSLCSARRPTRQTGDPGGQRQRRHSACSLCTNPGERQQQQRQASSASPGRPTRQTSDTEEQHQRRCPACCAIAQRPRRKTSGQKQGCLHEGCFPGILLVPRVCRTGLGSRPAGCPRRSHEHFDRPRHAPCRNDPSRT